MIKTILLLTPVYVTLFWAIALNTNANKFGVPRLFLGKFMICAFIVYFSHFLFFSPFPNIYYYLDPLYQYASLLVFPLYYIYFRLLTIDEKFSFKVHFRYLAIPSILFTLYIIGILFVPISIFKEWIFDRSLYSTTPAIRFLNVIYILMRIVFLIQVVSTVVGNYYLIKKHGDKALQYYSDLEDSSTKKVTILNTSMIITGLASLVLASLGKDFFQHEITGIALASVTFSTLLFIIGWLGDLQKALNPTFNTNTDVTAESKLEVLTLSAENKILDKVLLLFTVQKVYLDSKLTIQDIAQMVGTNRTYISSILNKHFNQNFCSIVNNFRIQELETLIQSHPEYTNQQLAELCGFGSVDSLKRAVSSKTTYIFQDWKKMLTNNNENM